MEFMLDVTAPFRRWQELHRVDPGPTPDRELGRCLETLDDVMTWLSHPSNWFRGDTYIIKWDGHVPTIADSQAWQLAPDSFGKDMMLKVVLQEHNRRKRGGFKETDREVLHQGDSEDM